jgi:2',3'-cyclic-nucleotide 2'-phosphodiesterase (5'-nucleotidase family)
MSAIPILSHARPPRPRVPSVATAPAPGPDRKASSAVIPILEIGGFHGYLEPYRSPDIAPSGLVGGAPALTALMRSEQEKNGKGLVISGGDFFQGPPLATVFKGRPVIEFMNEAGYDCMTLGNHDFDQGVDVLAQRLEEARFPALAANLLDAASGRPIWESSHPLHMVRPYHVKMVDGARVAVVGLMKPETPRLTSSENVASLRWKPIDETLRELLPGLVERERPDVVVLHCQHIQLSEQILAQARAALNGLRPPTPPGRGLPILMFVGGHGDPNHRDAKVSATDVIVQGTDRGAELNRTVLTVDLASHRLLSVDHADVPVLAGPQRSDPAVARIVARYKAQLGAQFAAPLGSAATPLDRSRHADSALGNRVTEAMRERMTAEVAFLAGGSLKSDIQPGRVTAGDVYEAIPFHNRCVVVEMSGRELQAALEKSAARPSGDKVLQMSGAEMVYDSRRPVGARIVSCSVGGRPIDPKRAYRVAIDDFLASGGDFFTEFKSARPLEQAERPLVRDLLADVFRGHEAVSGRADGRIRDIAAG